MRNINRAPRDASSGSRSVKIVAKYDARRIDLARVLYPFSLEDLGGSGRGGWNLDHHPPRRDTTVQDSVVCEEAERTPNEGQNEAAEVLRRFAIYLIVVEPENRRSGKFCDQAMGLVSPRPERVA